VLITQFGARVARRDRRIKKRCHRRLVRFGEASDNRTGGGSKVCAIQIEPDTLAQLRYLFFRDARICAPDAGDAAVRTCAKTVEDDIDGRRAMGMRRKNFRPEMFRHDRSFRLIYAAHRTVFG